MLEDEYVGNIKEIREEYPILKHWVYLNAGDQAPPARYWMEAIKECLGFYQAGKIEDVVPYGEATHPFLAPVFFETIKKSAKLIHAKKEEVTNHYRIMTGANLIINDLLKWERGDNTVFTDLDYPSIPYILMNLRRKKGIELRRINHRGKEIPIDELEKAIDDRTRLVVINHTMPWSGYTYNNIKEISNIAHDHGAYVIDDAFQTVGAMDVDVHKDGIDFLLTGSYKWQCGPEGAGIFYVRQEIIDEFDPDFRNYLWVEVPSGIPFESPEHDNVKHWDYPMVKTANRFEMGTCVTPILFGWNATLDFLLDIGIKNIENRVKMLGSYLIDRLYEIGCEVITPENRNKRHGLIVYTTGDRTLDKESFERFNKPPMGEKPIKVTLRFVGGLGGIRVSTHFFNTKDEIDYLIEVQEKLLKQRK